MSLQREMPLREVLQNLGKEKLSVVAPYLLQVTYYVLFYIENTSATLASIASGTHGRKLLSSFLLLLFKITTCVELLPNAAPEQKKQYLQESVRLFLEQIGGKLPVAIASLGLP